QQVRRNGRLSIVRTEHRLYEFMVAVRLVGEPLAGLVDRKHAWLAPVRDGVRVDAPLTVASHQLRNRRPECVAEIGVGYDGTSAPTKIEAIARVAFGGGRCTAGLTR